MQINYLSLIIPLIFAVGHAIGHLVRVQDQKFAENTRSFAAGFTSGFMFLVLIPEVILLGDGLQLLSTSITPMFWTFVGFVLFHLALKYLDSHLQGAEAHRHKLKVEVHLFVIALYNLLVTFSLVELAQSSFGQALVISVLFIIHLTLTELAEHSDDPASSRIDNFQKLVVLIFSVILGSLLPIVGFLDDSVTAALFGLAAGSIIYISVREEIPPEQRSHPALFLFGALLIAVLSILFGTAV